MEVSSSKNKGQLILVAITLFVLKCGSQIHAQDNDFAVSNEIKGEMDTAADYEPNELLTKEKVEEISGILAKLLVIPWPQGVAPLVYVEKSSSGREVSSNDVSNEIRLNEIESEETMRPVSSKRSRYYRRYPWKRQQNRKYEPSYVCTPKKEDVYRLLLALHGERNGKRGQLVDFCNRKRPASFVFTNIRFVG